MQIFQVDATRENADWLRIARDRMLREEEKKEKERKARTAASGGKEKPLRGGRG